VLADRPRGVVLVALPSADARWTDYGEIPRACHWAYARNRDGQGVYWTPAETAEPRHCKPKKEHLERTAWVHVDVDPHAENAEDLQRERIGIEAQLRAADPDLLIDSGRGYWALWRLLVPFEDGDGLAHAERVNRALIVTLGGDPGTHNVDRLCRLPGSVNWPNKAKVAKGAVPRAARCLLKNFDRWRAVDVVLAGIPGAAEALAAEEEVGVVPRRALAGARGATAVAGAPLSLRPLSLDDLVSMRFPAAALRIAYTMTDRHGRPYPHGRSGACFAFARACAAANRYGGAHHLTGELCARALLCADLPIGGHVYDTRDPAREAARIADLAYQSTWRRRRRGGAA
jgi:hypothetical protein